MGNEQSSLTMCCFARDKNEHGDDSHGNKTSISLATDDDLTPKGNLVFNFPIIPKSEVDLKSPHKLEVLPSIEEKNEESTFLMGTPEKTEGNVSNLPTIEKMSPIRVGILSPMRSILKSNPGSNNGSPQVDKINELQKVADSPVDLIGPFEKPEEDPSEKLLAQNEFTDENGHYSGGWKNGQRTGYGKQEYSDGSIYEGMWRNDKPNGKGRKIFPFGDIYDGEWKNDKPHGKGRYFIFNRMTYLNDWPNKACYTGEFKEGFKHGKGRLITSDGQDYEGKWENDLKNGDGRLLFTNGNMFIGKFYMGKFGEKGAFTWMDGTKFDGLWRDAKPGYGNFKGNFDTIHNEFWSTDTSSAAQKLRGTKYIGNWHDNLPHQIGIIEWPDGSKYEGYLKMGVKEGKGKMTYSDGSVYHGEFLRDQRDGFGVMIWKNGDEYEGQWKSNSRFGNGKFKWADGRVFEGFFERDAENGPGTLKSVEGSTLKGEWKNGKIVR